MSSLNLRRSPRLHPSTPAQDFRLFVKLPPELRTLIWKYALRCPETPAVHFFSLVTANARSQPGYRSECLYPVQQETLWSYLGPPGGPVNTRRNRNRKRNPFSWTRRNASAYLIDSGLWTACRESREVIRHHWEDKPITPLVSPLGYIERWEWSRDQIILDNYESTDAGEGAAAVSWFPSSNDAKGNSKITFFPAKDLVCLTNVSREGMPSHTGLGDRHIFDMSDDDEFDIPTGFEGLTNLALPFYVGWERMNLRKFASNFIHGEFPSIHYLRHILLRVHGPRKVWFIDYRIKISREEFEGLEKQGHAVFHGMGLRLVEIREPLSKGTFQARGYDASDAIGVLNEMLQAEFAGMAANLLDEVVTEVGLLACLRE